MKAWIVRFTYCVIFLAGLHASATVTSVPAKKKVLIGAPIRQKPAILFEFLVSLEELNKNNFDAYYCFVDDNTDKESIQILDNFMQAHLSDAVLAKAENIGDIYICNETTHYWSEGVIWKVAHFKDMIMQYAYQNGYDYVFLIDSDIVLYPNTIDQLIADNKDIVSEIFWTSWTPDSPKKPQVWLYDTYTQYETHYGENLTPEEISNRHLSFIQMLLTPGVYEVGGLGACTLISKKAMERGVSFKKIKNLTIWGEDRHFCIRALALGLELFVDTHYPAYHIYRESNLEGVKQFKENCKNGLYQV